LIRRWRRVMVDLKEVRGNRRKRCRFFIRLEVEADIQVRLGEADT
jgi:hypothetical protein